MLIYTRPRSADGRDDPLSPGDSVWSDEQGNIQLWRGYTHWYWVKPDGSTGLLGPVDWPDGDAIALYRAKMRIASGAEP